MPELVSSPLTLESLISSTSGNLGKMEQKESLVSVKDILPGL